jgi:hypothetical protein
MYVADEGLPSDIVRVEHQLGGSATVKIKSNQSICTVGSLEGHILYVDVQTYSITYRQMPPSRRVIRTEIDGASGTDAPSASCASLDDMFTLLPYKLLDGSWSGIPAK